MKALTRLILVLVLVVVAAGGVALMLWEVPPPTAPVEKTIPNTRFSSTG